MGLEYGKAMLLIPAGFAGTFAGLAIAGDLPVQNAIHVAFQTIYHLPALGLAAWIFRRGHLLGHSWITWTVLQLLAYGGMLSAAAFL